MVYRHCVEVQQSSIRPPVFGQVLPVESHVPIPLSEDPQAEPSNTQADNSTIETTREKFMVHVTEQLVFCAEVRAVETSITEPRAGASANQVSRTPSHPTAIITKTEDRLT